MAGQSAGKPDKVPFNPKSRYRAKPNDRATFGTHAEAEKALATGQYEGRCVLIDETLGVTGGDLDDVIPADRAFDETALPGDVKRIIRIANTWTCWSPSGTGIRFIFAASLGQTYMTKNRGALICKAEAYNRLRFMTLLPDRRIAGTPETFNRDPDDLRAWYEALGFSLRAPEQPATPPPPTYSGGTRTDDDIIEAASRVNGEKFRRLWAGDITGYPESQSAKGRSSEADAALVMILCGYTDDDNQVADLWRRSGQHRAKLNRGDYVDRTIAGARAKQSWWFDWDHHPTEQPATNPMPHHAFAGEDRAQETPDADNTCSAQLAAALRDLAHERQRCRDLEAANAQLAATVATLRERVRGADEREAIQRNTKLGAARQTGAALATLFRSERPREPDSDTPFRMPLAKLADLTGQSADTCSRQLRQIEKFRTEDGRPVLHVETRDVPRTVDVSTGEITEPHREVWVGPGVEPSAFGYVLAALAPDASPKHGGKRTKGCPEHPNADIVRTWQDTCGECGIVLETGQSERRPDPIQQDAFGHDGGPPEPADPMPQDAASLGNHSVVTTLSGKMRYSPPRSGGPPPEYRPGPLGSPGLDPYTDPGWRTS